MGTLHISQNLKIKQTLSQKMIQSVGLLQMNSQELSEYISELSLENPMIELASEAPADEQEMRLRKLEWLAGLDEQNRAYIIYPVKDIAEDLKISLRKAIDYLTELENFGLIEKKQRGQGKPSIIYVKNFIYQDPKG